jgi:hypothetical protein
MIEAGQRRLTSLSAAYVCTYESSVVESCPTRPYSASPLIDQYTAPLSRRTCAVRCSCTAALWSQHDIVSSLLSLHSTRTALQCLPQMLGSSRCCAALVDSSRGYAALIDILLVVHTQHALYRSTSTHRILLFQYTQAACSTTAAPALRRFHVSHQTALCLSTKRCVVLVILPAHTVGGTVFVVVKGSIWMSCS